MSSERRIVRPYVGLERFQSILDKWFFRIGPEQLEANETRTVPNSSFLHDPGVLVCAPDEDVLQDVRKEAVAAAEAVGLDAKDIELVVLAATPYLRMADVVYRRGLSEPDAIPLDVRLEHGDAVRALETASGGCDIDVYLSLADALPTEPLKPSRRGTWLGHVRFSLRTDLGDLGFTPLPLTSEKREELKLGDDVIRFVEVNADALMEENLADAVELYVDEEVLAVLNQTPTAPAARFFQRQMFLDVIAEVLRVVPQISPEGSLTLASIDNTVIGRIVDAAAGRGRRGETEDEMTGRTEHALGLMLHDPGRFMTLVENAAAPRDDLKAAIGGFDE